MTTYHKRFFYTSLICTVIIGVVAILTTRAQTTQTTAVTAPVVWESVDIASRDTYLGPGEGKIVFVPEGMRYLGPEVGGNNPKYRIKDGEGIDWVVKIADESRAEVAAVRLLWAIGYKTEVDHIVKKITIHDVGTFSNARFEARPKGVKRGERWSWDRNPLTGSKQMDALKLMMALINNWDLKDDNNVIIEQDGRTYLMVSDLGSSFGKLAVSGNSRAGRSVSKPKDFAEENFIKGVNGGMLEVNYRGAAENVMKGIPVSSGRWLADLLMQLSDKQISEAFRAANYDEDDILLYTSALKSRIRELDEATKAATAQDQVG